MNRLFSLYQISLGVLALVAVWLLTLPEDPAVYWANLVIWLIFLADYLVRIAMASNRRLFVQENRLDLVAVVPLDYLVELLLSMDLFGFGRLARLARLVRVTRLLRSGVILWRVSHNLQALLRTNGLGYVLVITFSVVILGGISLWIVEPEIGSVGDGIWWSLVTVTTVGYGDISPATPIGRVIAGTLMLTGIGTIGMITSTLATFFMGRTKSSNPHIQHVITHLERWDDLTDDERAQLISLLTLLSHRQDSQLSAGAANGNSQDRQPLFRDNTPIPATESQTAPPARHRS